MRLVHLDLKGAAPRVSYLEEVFPLLSQLGANGVLIEYEDMFPFKGELEILRSPYAYSEEDIERIQQLAELHKLEVVPLVQTFGHVEVGGPGPGPASRGGAPGAPLTAPPTQFILKHEKYQHLREVERFPNSFNPHAPDTLALLKSILSQVMEKHKRSTWIHIGADEVFHLGEGMDSKNWMSRNKGDTGTMYLNHIKEVLGFISTQYWGLRVLMWDDMLRKISVGALRGERMGMAVVAPKLGVLAAPSGHPGSHTRPCHNWPRCASRASSSPAGRGEGQQDPCPPQCPPSLVQEVMVWLVSLHRYDHYSVLCELLPVGIPSLAICLQTLVNGGFTEETKRKVLDTLGFQSMQLEQSTCEGRGAFPGAEIYHMVEQVNGHLKESILKTLEEESAIKGWFSPYHRKRQFGNPRNMETFGSKVLKLHEDWESFVHDLRAHLERVYFPDTVEEWMEENVNPYLDQLRDLVRDYR
ncbi:HEXDC Hexosaminidase, partial [Brachypteracias leptosomus]|nr:HEXDC Hexosaminidase [Brachypteracias leptosomus]